MTLSESYRNRLRELSGIISESRKSEELGLNILDKANIANPENVIRAFAEKDKSNNQKNIPVMAYLFSLGNADEKSIVSVLNNYDDLEIKKRIKPIHN
jgi:Icc-related predicted phosphoesterase